MGTNDRGVVIGNEAVFSNPRISAAKAEGVLGMEILRATLASCSGAAEAVEFICRCAERFDQGGNASFRRPRLVYSNSYLVSDSSSGYIVETAGRRWAWRPAGAVDSISNIYVIEEDYKRLDTQTRKEIAPVNERAACSDEADPGRKGVKESWKARMELPLPARLSHAGARRSASLAALEAGRGGMDIARVFGILRSHLSFDPARPGGGRRMESLCMHAGRWFPRVATTASMAVEHRPGGDAVIWFTGTSSPCISLYKPVLLVGGTFVPLWTGYDYGENSETALEIWNRQRRRIRAGADTRASSVSGLRDRLQAELVESAAEPPRDAGDLERIRRRVGEIVGEWESSF